MRRFYVRAFDDANNLIMSSIQVIVPDVIPLDYPSQRFSSGVEADLHAVAYVVGRVAEEFARYGASECLLAYDPKAKP